VTRESRFARFVWGTLAYTIFVILFGAVVRITGSGAGCGQHWPTCHGEITHLPRSVETAIELTHRLTSGVSLLLVLAALVLAVRTFAEGHPARGAAWLSMGFMVSESLVGAALVLLRLVGENTSLARAAVMAVHLVNTSFLSAAIALTAWLATRPAPREWRPICALEGALLGALGAILVVSVTGAITALGDTLYPVALAERIAADHGVTATFLERGRAVHPVLAVLAAGFLLGVAAKVRELRPHAATLAWWGTGLVVLQVGAGVVNILLYAPGWMQVIHLAIGTVLWIALALLYVAAKRPVSAAPPNIEPPLTAGA
jgi:heme A synthase